jgi:hypothetical protein
MSWTVPETPVIFGPGPITRVHATPGRTYLAVELVLAGSSLYGDAIDGGKRMLRERIRAALDNAPEVAHYRESVRRAEEALEHLAAAKIELVKLENERVAASKQLSGPNALATLQGIGEKINAAVSRVQVLNGVLADIQAERTDRKKAATAFAESVAKPTVRELMEEAGKGKAAWLSELAKKAGPTLNGLLESIGVQVACELPIADAKAAAVSMLDTPPDPATDDFEDAESVEREAVGV